MGPGACHRAGNSRTRWFAGTTNLKLPHRGETPASDIFVYNERRWLKPSCVVPANAGTHTPRPIGETQASDIFVCNERRWLWVPEPAIGPAIAGPVGSQGRRI